MAKYESGGGGVLPAEYQQVEYIAAERKGAYINPNLTIGADSAIKVKFMILSQSVYPHTDVFGYSGSAANFLVRYELRNGASRYDIWRTTGTNKGLRYGIALNTEYEVSININGEAEAIVNDDNLGAIPYDSVPTYNTYIMASYGISGGSAYASGCQRIYYAQFYESGELVRDLYPCYRISDSEPGMYDIVNDVFYTNAGSGSFVVGGGSNYLIISALCRNQERRAA